MRERLLKGEGGFSLPEVLVTMVMMITVMFALYAIFDMSLRVFSFGNDKTEAVENARIGLERMEREIRAAYPYDKPDNTTLLDTWNSDEITFGNDLDGNRKIECPDPVVDSNTECEIITYQTYTPSGSTTEALGRANSYGGNNQAVVEFVKDLNFEYLDESGCVLGTVGCPDRSEPNIDMVRITLVTEVDRGLGEPTGQTLTTDVALRNGAD